MRIILDSDFGSSTDDLLTLLMMHRYADQGKCEVLGVIVDREGEDIYFSPGEVGDMVEYPIDMVINDISWTDIHPIKQVYMNYDCNTGQKMWDPMPLIQIVEGDHLFTISESGTVELTENAETIFTPDANGNCFYQIPGNEKWAEKLLNIIRRSL